MLAYPLVEYRIHVTVAAAGYAQTTAPSFITLYLMVVTMRKPPLLGATPTGCIIVPPVVSGCGLYTWHTLIGQNWQLAI